VKSKYPCLFLFDSFLFDRLKDIAWKLRRDNIILRPSADGFPTSTPTFKSAIKSTVTNFGNQTLLEFPVLRPTASHARHVVIYFVISCPPLVNMWAPEEWHNFCLYIVRMFDSTGLRIGIVGNIQLCSLSLFLSLSLSFSVAKRWRFRGHCEIWHLCVGPAKSLGCETESSLVLSASVNQPLFRNQVSQGGRAWRRARPGRRLTSLSVNLYSTPVWIEHGLSSTSSRVTRQNGPFATLKFRHRLIRKKNWHENHQIISS